MAQCQRLAIHTSGFRHDQWTPERLGVIQFDAMEAHRAGLSHRPGSVVAQKHTFLKEYFNSKACKDLLKVAWEGSVRVEIQDGRFMTTATRRIKAGEVIERGILRGIGMGVLHNAAPNPFCFKLGHDFLFNAAFPWGQYSDVAPPPFLSSGTLNYYQCGQNGLGYNVKVVVKESPVEGFEFDTVAAEDIPAGSPLVRRVAEDTEAATVPRYGDTYHMSDDQVDKFLEFAQHLEESRAADAGVEPQVLHEEAIREHTRLTRSGEISPIENHRSVTLPHPTWGGFGVFACEDIKAGQIVESGLMGKINGLHGDKCPYVFTWNSTGKRFTDGTENMWATASGNAMFYNSDNPSNARMYRFYDHSRFLMVAKTDIKAGEEIMHLYVSSSWRKCFVEDSSLPKLQPVEDGHDA